MCATTLTNPSFMCSTLRIGTNDGAASLNAKCIQRKERIGSERRRVWEQLHCGAVVAIDQGTAAESSVTRLKGN
jgi:hypothetical protein